VIIEANACGTPVIGSNSGRFRCDRSRWNRGPEQNSDALAAAIRRLANEPVWARLWDAWDRSGFANAYTGARLPGRCTRFTDAYAMAADHRILLPGGLMVIRYRGTIGR